MNNFEKFHQSPLHLFRRCHQISNAIFASELGHSGLTNIQYGTLFTINSHPGINQRQLGHLMATDRTTTSSILKKLESLELIKRGVPTYNLRIKTIETTPKGAKLINDTKSTLFIVQDKFVHPLNAFERETLKKLLKKMSTSNEQIYI